MSSLLTRRLVTRSSSLVASRRSQFVGFPVLAATFRVVVLSALFLSQPLTAFSTCSAGTCSASSRPISSRSLHPAMLKPALPTAPLADIRLRPVANGAIIPDSTEFAAENLWNNNPSDGDLAAVVIYAVRRPG